MGGNRLQISDKWYVTQKQYPKYFDPFLYYHVGKWSLQQIFFVLLFLWRIIPQISLLSASIVPDRIHFIYLNANIYSTFSHLFLSHAQISN